MLRFWKFVNEEMEKPSSGPLEADPTRNLKRGTLEVSPSRIATILRMSRELIADRKAGGTEKSPTNKLMNSLRKIEAAGVKGSKLGEYLSTARRELNRDPEYGGLYRKLAKKYQETDPTGKNLDVEA